MESALHVSKQQSSFIPNKAGQGKKRKGYNNFFIIISLTIFFIAIIAWGGLLFYKAQLTGNLGVLEEELEIKTRPVVDQASVNTFRTLASRLSIVDGLLDSHIVITPIIELIETLTLTGSVRFSDFSFTSTNGFVVKLSGQAKNFRSLAYQEFLFFEEPFIITPVFEDFSLSEETGDVRFSVSFGVDPELIKYSNTIGLF